MCRSKRCHQKGRKAGSFGREKKNNNEKKKKKKEEKKKKDRIVLLSASLVVVPRLDFNFKTTSDCFRALESTR